jgi:hypothetical protein
MSILGTIWRADDQESERRAVPSLNMASNSALAMASRSGASRCGRQVTGGPGVVLWRTSRSTLVRRMRSGTWREVCRHKNRHWWLSRWGSANWQLGQGQTTTWLRPADSCSYSPPGGRNGRGSRPRWGVVWRRATRTGMWTPCVIPGWGWGAVIRRCGW